MRTKKILLSIFFVIIIILVILGVLIFYPSKKWEFWKEETYKGMINSIYFARTLDRITFNEKNYNNIFSGEGNTIIQTGSIREDIMKRIFEDEKYNSYYKLYGKKGYEKIKILKIREKCFVIELLANTYPDIRKYYNMTPFMNYLRDDYNKSGCDVKNYKCNIYLTEKGVLGTNDKYECE